MKKIILLVLILLYGYTQIYAVNSIPDLHSMPSENTASPASATSASSSDIEIGAVHNNYISTTIYNSPLSTGVGYRCKQFLDGLGNPSEMVYVRYTPNKKDLYSLQEYDAKNRVDKSWLSLPSSGDLGEYIPVDELRDLTCEYYGDTAPYSKTTYFRFSSVRLNRLRNKLLANYLKSGGNELATVRISAFCVAMLSNNSFICKYSIFFRKYELSAAVL